jgi:hypothetical protein
MAQRRRFGRNALVLRDARALEIMRLKRQASRGRNFVFLLALGLLAWLCFTRVSAYQHGYALSVTQGNAGVDGWLPLTMGFSGLAFFPLCALLMDIFDINGTPRHVRGQDVLFFLLCASAGITAAVALQYSWQAFAFLPIQSSDSPAGYCFVAALVSLGLIFFVRRVFPLPVFRQVSGQIFCGLLLAALLYFTLGRLLTFAGQLAALTGKRLWHVPVFFLLLWPFFLLDEGICRGYQEQGALRALFASLFFKLLLVGGLVIGAALTPGLSFVNAALPGVVLLLIFLVALGTQIYVSGRAALASATLCALVLAWFMAALFPIVS